MRVSVQKVACYTDIFLCTSLLSTPKPLQQPDYTTFSMADLHRRNDAVRVNDFTQNDKTAAIHQTVRGSDWYFAVCAIMGATAVTILALSRRKPRTDRIFFYLSSGLCFVACIAYFAMGSNLGWTPIDVEYARSNPKVSGRNRQIFYVRYIDWYANPSHLIFDTTCCLPSALQNRISWRCTGLLWYLCHIQCHSS